MEAKRKGRHRGRTEIGDRRVHAQGRTAVNDLYSNLQLELMLKASTHCRIDVRVLERQHTSVRFR